MKSLSFISHHSSWGSYASFILGKENRGGGFALSQVQSPEQNVYFGYQRGTDPIRMFPFLTEKEIGVTRDRYVQDNPEDTDTGPAFEVLPLKDITETLDWCTHNWNHQGVGLSLFTPFDKIPEIKQPLTADYRFYLAPVISGEIVVDNRHSQDPLTGLFALQGLRRPLSDSHPGIVGAASGRSAGLAFSPSSQVEEILDWEIINTAFEGGPLRRLAYDGGIRFRVGPGEMCRIPFVLGTYQEGIITSGYETGFYYTSLFSSLEEVLEFGLSQWHRYRELAMTRDQQLKEADLNEDQRFLLAHSTRSYLANSQFLMDQKGQGLYVVNEGEYQMINTMDLVVDQMFWELEYTPWVIKNILDQFSSRYLVNDCVGDQGDTLTTFTHDMGVANMFTPPGTSSYELPGLTGCFSFMCYEELLNWILTAGVYGLLKDRPWLEEQKELLGNLLFSLKKRDRDGDGIMDADSRLCQGGAEITTYDSLDASLGQVRNNLYGGVKTWGAYLVLAEVFGVLGEKDRSQEAWAEGGKTAETLMTHFENGRFPAVFEGGIPSYIIPAVEGLIYPYMVGLDSSLSESGPFGELIGALKTHIKGVLVKGVCLDSQSGGWKLSSTSENTWMSKIFINQFVVRRILGLSQDYPWDEWDRIHAGWQKEGCSDFAATDQVNSIDGRALGSRLYPRLVTSVLWLYK